jgi:SAM-dependent methyltransferase
MITELAFRALADRTRLRIMRLVVAMELAVGEIAQVLGQSQPRVSRHVALLCMLADLLAGAEEADPAFAAVCRDDRRKLASIRAAREVEAQDYFAAHASQWDELRSLHSADEVVEDALVKALAPDPVGRVLDIGTGTGRMAELFAASAEGVIAVDKSPAMLRLARARLQHLAEEGIEMIQGDFASLPLPEACVDTVLVHQVLHFTHNPAAALREAARVTRPGGRIAIVDFAAHQREDLRKRHAHARLGFEDAQIEAMLAQSGFALTRTIALDEGELVVKIWIGARSSPEQKAA